MASVSHYRKEAERCRQLADDATDREMARRWRGVARDYDKLADALAESLERFPPSRSPMQQQPVQQQQGKIEPDDK